jgi:2-hydroxy-3-keto-5-methylthiopentenyl-1-phosphate phosphatase
MMGRKTKVAFVYDFDGTLAPGNMQERSFIPEIGLGKKEFWKKVTEDAKSHNADNILIYMKHMLEMANQNGVQVLKSSFLDYGKRLEYFEGVLPNKVAGDKGWFDRINTYGKEANIVVEHYIVSSGIKEMIEGSVIRRKFKYVYASSFVFDHHNVAIWPALAVNYTTKTQYLFRINKGCLDVYDNKSINEYTRPEDRPLPFTNMMYIGDGETDIPCFRLTKDRGGCSVAVYKPRSSKSLSEQLLYEGRVDFISPADYREGKKLDQIAKGFIDKIQFNEHFKSIR